MYLVKMSPEITLIIAQIFIFSFLIWVLEDYFSRNAMVITMLNFIIEESTHRKGKQLYKEALGSNCENYMSLI